MVLCIVTVELIESVLADFLRVAITVGGDLTIRGTISNVSSYLGPLSTKKLESL